jgi:hypothetical protein
MKMIKVFTVNENGKIEFTKAELEKLLNEVYSDGYKKGKYDGQQSWTWTSPYLNGLSTTPYNGPITYCSVAATNESHPKLADVSVSNDEVIGVLDSSKTIDVNETVEAKPSAYTIKATSSDIDAVSKAIEEMLTNTRNSFYNHSIKDTNSRPLDAFDTLAKELNF